MTTAKTHKSKKFLYSSVGVNDNKKTLANNLQKDLRCNLFLIGGEKRWGQEVLLIPWEVLRNQKRWRRQSLSTKRLSGHTETVGQRM